MLLPSVLYDGKNNRITLRLVDKAAIRWMEARERRRKELQRCLLLRGGPPDDGFAVAWLRKHPVDDSLLARLQASFDALAGSETRRVDKLDFAEAVLGAAAMDPSPVLGMMVREEVLEDYFALGQGMDPPGTLSWKEFTAFWAALNAKLDANQHDARLSEEQMLQDAASAGLAGSQQQRSRHPALDQREAARRALWQAPAEAFVPPMVGVVAPPPTQKYSQSQPPSARAESPAREPHVSLPRAGAPASDGAEPFTGPAAWVNGMLPVVRLPRSGFGTAARPATPTNDAARKAAIDKFRTQLKHNTRDGWARLGLGMALHAGGDHRAAAAQYQAALQAGVGTTDGLVHYRLAMCLEEAGDVAAAIPALQRASSCLPRNADVLQDLGALLWAENRPWEAIQTWRDAVRGACVAFVGVFAVSFMQCCLMRCCS